MNTVPEAFDHPAWLTFISTVVGYALVLGLLLLGLFVVPFLLRP